MAGRYVLLEFDDQDSAMAFVTNPKEPELRGYRITAMFMKPKRFCECPDKKKKALGNWVKGKRTGLYLCSNCRRPSIHHQTGVFKRLSYVFGNNLLES